MRTRIGVRIVTAVLVVIVLLIAGPVLAEDEPDREEILRRMRQLDEERAHLERLLEREEEAPPALDEKETPPTPEEGPGAPVSDPGATDAEEDDADDGEIVITAKRYEAEEARATSSITRFGRDDLERRQTPIITEILKEVPSVNLRDTGPPGQAAWAYVRGAAGTQTLVLLDGIPLNDAGRGAALNFSGFTSSGIESVEVLLGSYGLLYGSSAIGAIIAMESRRGRGQPGGFALIEGGSFGTHREVVGVGGGDGDLHYHLTLSRYQTEGHEKRSAHLATELLGRFGIFLGADTDLEATVYYGDSETEIPFAQDSPPGGVLPREPNEENGLDRLAIGLNLTSDLCEWLTARVHGSVLSTRVSWDDGANGPTTFDPDGTPESGDEFEERVDEFHQDRTQLDYRGRVMLTGSLTDALRWPGVEAGGVEVELTVGGEYLDQATRDQQQFPDPSVTTRPTMQTSFLREDTQTKSLFTMLELAFPDGEWLGGGVLNGGFRWDSHSAFGSESSVFAGARVTILPTDTTLRTSYGEGFRAPTAAELYDPWFGNSDLGPETSESFDVSVIQKLFDGRVTASVTWFQLELSDPVVYSIEDRHLANAPEGSRSRGWECTLGADLGHGLTIRGSLTTSDNTWLGSGRRFSIPMFGSAGVSWTHGPFSASLDGFFSTEFKNWEPEFTAPDGEARDHPGRRAVVSLAMRYEVSDSIRVFGRLENLLDDDYVTTIWSAPGPPLGGYVGLEMRF